MAGTVLQNYEAAHAKGEIEADPAQRRVAARLDDVQNRLQAMNGAGGLLGRLMKRKAAPGPRGLYIHGPVGRGKTMLMDLFFESVDFEPKSRVHFHEFMADVHDRIAEARSHVDGDPIPHVARAIAAEARLLCFDELHVTDIADAMILGRLFQALFAAGTTVVATSNAHPADLYRNCLNRQLFLPFIALIEQHMEIADLDAIKDFRLAKISGAPLYFVPADVKARQALDKHWDRLTGRHPGKPAIIEFKGRKLHVPIASMGVARFPFMELCDRPLGALDYLHIAHAYHTVLIDGIPRLSRDRRDIARRFINLIDTLYDARVCLIASAEAEPHELYPEGDGADLFERTASRLMEMRSEAYLADRSGRTS